MSVGFPTAPLASGLRGASGGAVENPQPAQRFHYPDRKPVQLAPTTAPHRRVQIVWQLKPKLGD